MILKSNLNKVLKKYLDNKSNEDGKDLSRKMAEIDCGEIPIVDPRLYYNSNYSWPYQHRHNTDGRDDFP